MNSTRTASYFAEYIGRLVVHFEKDFRASYLLAENYVGKMEVVGIYREKYVCEPFPGYADLCIPFATLRQIYRTEQQSWKSALSAVYGIYLIIDSKNGKQYVGKADGNVAIWQRWAVYAVNGHGENVELKAISDEKGGGLFQEFLIFHPGSHHQE